MKRKIALRIIVDLGLAVTILPLLYTGIILWQIFPAGKGTGTKIYMGLSKFMWIDIHIYISFIFFAFLLLHLILNFKSFITFVKILLYD